MGIDVGGGAALKTLREALGLPVTLELADGTLYRGTLASLEDNMNATLAGAVRTAPSGERSAPIESVVVRGSSVRLFVVPDNIRHAPHLRGFGQGARDAAAGRAKGRGTGVVDISRERIFNVSRKRP